jgi:hypothetical protein
MRLYLLQLALLQPLGIPVPGYLIQTDDGTNVLVDTGFPYSCIERPPGPQPPLNLLAEMRPEDYILSRLSSIGLGAEDIHFLVCSHLTLTTLETTKSFRTQNCWYSAAIMKSRGRDGPAMRSFANTGTRPLCAIGSLTLPDAFCPKAKVMVKFLSNFCAKRQGFPTETP